MANFDMGSLGDYIRDQRRTAHISLRQLADAAGVSNPYLSQIERGLRKPSAEILQQIAKGLRISAEALYVQAGILERDESGTEAPAAIRADTIISERQKQVLLEIYESFCRENNERVGARDGSSVGRASQRGAGREGQEPNGKGARGEDVWTSVTD